MASRVKIIPIIIVLWDGITLEGAKKPGAMDSQAVLIKKINLRVSCYHRVNCRLRRSFKKKDGRSVLQTPPRSKRSFFSGIATIEYRKHLNFGTVLHTPHHPKSKRITNAKRHNMTALVPSASAASMATTANAEAAVQKSHLGWW
jgi:hypothetical protein